MAGGAVGVISDCAESSSLVGHERQISVGNASGRVSGRLDVRLLDRPAAPAGRHRIANAARRQRKVQVKLFWELMIWSSMRFFGGILIPRFGAKKVINCHFVKYSALPAIGSNTDIMVETGHFCVATALRNRELTW